MDKYLRATEVSCLLVYILINENGKKISKSFPFLRLVFCKTFCFVLVQQKIRIFLEMCLSLSPHCPQRNSEYFLLPLD